jgi:hypothetical protein
LFGRTPDVAFSQKDLVMAYISVVAGLNDPPIFFATLVSSALLIYLTKKRLNFLVALRFRATHDVPGLIVCVGLLIASFIGTGLLDLWLSYVAYKGYHSTKETLLLHVPVYLVWLVGVLAGIAFYGMRNLRMKSSSSPAQGQ